MEHKGISAAIVALIIVPVIALSLTITSGSATLGEPASATVRGGTRAKLLITVTNPCDDNVDNVSIWVSGSPGLLDNWIAGASARENLLLAADNLENVEPWIIRAGENIKLAAENKETAGPDIVAAGENLKAPDEDDWKADAAAQGGSTAEASHVWLNVETAAGKLVLAGKAFDNEIENFDYIYPLLKDAGLKLWRASGRGTGENLDNWAHDAAENMWLAGSYLDAAGNGLMNKVRLGAVGADFLVVADRLEDVKDSDNVTIADVEAALAGAAEALRAAGNKLVDAGNFIDNAGYCLGVAENYMRSVATYIGNVAVLTAASGYFGDVADNLAGAEDRMREDWLLMAGENLVEAADDLSSAADVLGAALGGDELGDAASDLGDAGENLSDSGQVNLTVAGQKLVDAGNNITAAAITMASAAGDISPATWEVGSSSMDRIRFDAIGENYLSPSGGSETFTFLVDVADIGNIENTYTLVIKYYKVGKNFPCGEDSVSLTVDGEKPGITAIEVTQENAGTTNLINQGTALLTITASEPLSLLGDVTIENEGVFLTIPGENFDNTGNTVFTYGFTAGAWDENSPVTVKVVSVKDLVGNENKAITPGSFTVDTKPPIFLDNGLLTLVSGMVQKTKADGTTYAYVDNEKSYEFSGGVVDNFQGGNVQGYNNVTVTIEVDGTTYDAIYNMPENENLFYVVDGITLNEGANIVTVTATDRTGNSVSDNIDNMLIDTRPPTISGLKIEGVTCVENMYINDNKPSLEVTITDPGFVDCNGLGVAFENIRVELWGPGGFGGSLVLVENSEPYSPTDGVFENNDISAGNELAEGRWCVRVWASDNLNENVQENCCFIIDVGAPDIDDLIAATDVIDTETGLEVPSGATVKEDTLNVVGTADEPGSTVHIYVDTTEKTVVSDETDGSFSTTIDLSEGINKIYVKEVDVAGNESEKKLLASITADWTPPTVTITEPTTGTSTDEVSITVKGKVTDTVAKYDELFVTLDATGAYVQKTIYLNPDGSFSTTVPLTEGTNVITLYARDQAGNQDLFSITVDRSVTSWYLYFMIVAIVIVILAAIAVLRK